MMPLTKQPFISFFNLLRWYILFSSLLYSPKLLADLFYAEENVNMLWVSSPLDDVITMKIHVGKSKSGSIIAAMVNTSHLQGPLNYLRSSSIEVPIAM